MKNKIVGIKIGDDYNIEFIREDKNDNCTKRN